MVAAKKKETKKKVSEQSNKQPTNTAVL